MSVELWGIVGCSRFVFAQLKGFTYVYEDQKSWRKSAELIFCRGLLVGLSIMHCDMYVVST